MKPHLALEFAMKRAVILAFFFLFSILPVQADEGTYVFILTTRANPYWTAMAEGAANAAKAKGVKTVVYNTDNAAAAEQQLNICETAIQSKPKAIVMAAINPSIAAQCFKKAAAHGIIVADVDGSYAVAAAQKDGVKLAFSVGSDNFVIGQEAAQYVAKTAAKPDPKILVLEGVVGSTQGKKRVDGFTSKIKELMPKAQIVASICADYDRLKAMNATLDLLQRTPDLDVVYAANDEMALGAVEATRHLKLKKKIIFIGIDGTVDGRNAIKDGHLTASVSQLPYLMGKRAVEMLSEAKVEAPAEKSETTPTPVLTKEMLEAGIDPVLQYLR